MEEHKNNLAFYLSKLNMKKHEEGGMYAEVFKNEDLTSIYYLVKGEEQTNMRKLMKSSEMVIYQDGAGTEILLIDPKGQVEVKILGKNLDKKESMQIILPKDYIAAFKCQDRSVDSYSLFACVCSPPFDYDNFSLAELEEVYKMFPKLSEEDKLLLEEYFR